jgi:nucleoside-diphosphate-sugar epimerase
MIVVTGASGHVGCNLVRALFAEGKPVRALVHEGGRALDGVAVEKVHGDVLDPASIDRAFAGAELVFHLAARISITGDPDGRVRAVNVDGTRNVMAAARRAGVRRVVHMSSIHALAPTPRELPIDEERPLYETDDALAYERSKAAGEREVQAAVAAGLDAVVVNPTAVIGPFDFSLSATGAALIEMYHGRIPALVDGGFDWVDVRDVVAGAIAAAEKGRKGERYLLSGTWAPVRELAEAMARATGRRAPRFTSPMWLARASAPLAELYSRASGKRALFTGEALKALRNWRSVSHAKATRELGYQPRPLDATMADTFAWFGGAGML